MRANGYEKINLLQTKVLVKFADGIVLDGRKLLEGVRSELNFWKTTNINKSKLRDSGLETTIVRISTDASSKVYGIDMEGCRLAGQFQQQNECIFLKEARAVTTGLNMWLSKQKETTGQTKILILVDNLTVVESFKRGRSRNLTLNEMIQSWNKVIIEKNGECLSTIVKTK